MNKYKVLDHNLVPEHTIASDEEIEELIETHDIDLKNIPKVLKTDPVVKELDAETGDVLRIVRKSPTAGKSLTYRLVIDEEVGGGKF